MHAVPSRNQCFFNCDLMLHQWVELKSQTDKRFKPTQVEMCPVILKEDQRLHYYTQKEGEKNGPIDCVIKS